MKTTFTTSNPTSTHRRKALQMGLSGLLFGTLGGSFPALAQQPLALATTINRAGRLRALSQRIAKTYAQSTLVVLPERSPEVMLTTQRLVDTNLAELARAELPAELNDMLKACARDAEKLTGLTVGTPDINKLADISKAADQMQISADRLTLALEGRGKAAAKIVNMAGRQRMLSQRIAKAYMLVEANQDAVAMRRQLGEARSEFGLALEALESASVTTSAIKQDLILARAQWMFYQIGLDGKDKANARRDVATTSERLLEVSHNLTGLYEIALRDILGSVATNDVRYAQLGRIS